MVSIRPVAIVTAAGRGMGAACARTLAGEGYKVVLLSQSSAATELAQALGGTGMKGFVVEPDDLGALVDLAMSTYGRIDGLVINTGITPRTLNLHASVEGPRTSYNPNNTFDPNEISDEEWLGGFDMMFLNVVRRLRLAVPIFRRQKAGSVVASLPLPHRNHGLANRFHPAFGRLYRLFSS